MSISYVNCSTGEDESLSTIQLNGELHYRISRNVQAGEAVE